MSLSECHDQSSIGTLPQATNPARMNAKVDQVVTNSKTDSLREKKQKTDKGKKLIDIDFSARLFVYS